MNKIKVTVITAVLLIFIQGIGFGQEQGVSAVQESPKDYESLLKEYQELKHDRDNVLSQTKRLLQEKSAAADLETTVKKLQEEKKVVELEKEEISKKILALEDNIKQLQDVQAEISKERDEIKAAYEKINSTGAIKELKDKISGLQKEKNKLEADLGQAKKNIEHLSEQKIKTETENDKLTAGLEEYKKNYSEAAKKNKGLEDEIKHLPKKFSEIARQNKILLKDTAQMHYNLGVFYIKNKEYSRAAAEFEKSIEINSDDAYAYFNLGYIYAEYLVNRKKATENFRHYLRLAKSDDKDVDWVRKYVLTWETYEGKQPMQ